MITMPTDRLYNKYVIEKRDGSPIDPKAQYFVMRLDTDICARIAARIYAECCEAKWPGLADELLTLVESLGG